MNNLSLQWQTEMEPGSRNLGKPILHISINDTPLMTMVHDFESTSGYSHFNDTYLPAEDVQYYSVDGWRKSTEPGKSHIILLGCTCGDVDCSHFYVETFCQDGWIHWRFKDSSTRDFSGMPTLWFEQYAYRRQVETALEHLNR
ncbi:hypothetical protein QP938_05670 [Porticoccaceae bacterium LTM1]|nr:hypothetical protein QP938_05670 [Porticoccaceae bacterium LTM1]